MMSKLPQDILWGEDVIGNVSAYPALPTALCPGCGSKLYRVYNTQIDWKYLCKEEMYWLIWKTYNRHSLWKSSNSSVRYKKVPASTDSASLGDKTLLNASQFHSPPVRPFSHSCAGRI